MNILAIANAKGGVGKTTTALSLAAALVEGKGNGAGRALLIDLDPGGGLTGSLRQGATAAADSALCLFVEPTKSPAELAVETPIEGVDLIPSHPSMAGLDAHLAVTVDREKLLRRVLRESGFDKEYSWVLLDCGPYMGVLSVLALTAAEQVLLPLPPEYVVLLGGKMLLEFVTRIRQELNPDLRILGILPTMVDSRTRHAREMLDQLRAVFDDLVFDVEIPYTVRLKEAPILGTSILAYAPRSGAALAYRRLAEEVRARCRKSA